MRHMVSLAILVMLVAAPAAFAVEHGAPAAALAGTKIAQRESGGYALTYQLLDLKERAAWIKGMEGMAMPGMIASPDVTNHLVVYLKGKDGVNASGTVGFQITGPDGKVVNTLTMDMGGGYGADVIWKAAGTYKIRMKAKLAGGAQLDDTFDYLKK